MFAHWFSKDFSYNIIIVMIIGIISPMSSILTVISCHDVDVLFKLKIIFDSKTLYFVNYIFATWTCFYLKHIMEYLKCFVAIYFKYIYWFWCIYIIRSFDCIFYVKLLFFKLFFWWYFGVKNYTNKLECIFMCNALDIYEN